MKRSHSAQNQKHNKKSPKVTNKKVSKQQIKLRLSKSPILIESDLKTQRPQTCRNNFEERLNKIRQGFQQLQKNFETNNIKSLSPMAAVQSEITSRKVARKLFHNQSTKKTVIKTKPYETDRFQKKTSSPLKGTPKSSKYHSCIYERSLYDLMKIVIIQKNEIIRLNSEIKVCKLKK